MAFKVTKETMKALCRDVKLTKPQATEKKSLIVLRLVRKFLKSVRLTVELLTVELPFERP